MKTKMFNLYSVRQKMKGYNFNWLMYLLVVLFFIGLVIGSFSVKNSENFFVAKLSDYYMNYLQEKSTYSFLSIFLNTFLLSLTAVTASFFVGLCAVGVPFVAAIPAISGVIIGVVSGYIYESFLLKGLGYCAIIIFPAAAIAVGAIIFSCKESMLMSKNMLALLGNGRISQQQSFKKYCLKFLIYVSVCAFGALIEAMLSNLFADLFIF